MWVPSCSVMSGGTHVKGAKATSTDSPPKGYGTPNLVDVTGRWLVSGISIPRRGSLISGLWSHGSKDHVVRSLVHVSVYSAAGPHTAGDRPKARSVAGKWECQPIL